MISLTTVRTGSVPEERAHRVFEVAGGDFGGKLMVTRSTGRAVREALEETLTTLPKGGTLYVDTRGVELMDYSFADEALGIRVDEVGGEPGIVGEVPEHLVATLQAIYDAGSITNAALAAKLGLNHTACNNRATRLAKLGLIHRRTETAAPGGRQYSYERVV